MVESKKLPGMSVAICVNDEPLTEYEDPTFRPTLEDTHSIVAARQVMSTAGDNFSIKISLHPSFQMITDTVCCKIYIDGISIRGRLFRRSAFTERGRSLTSIIRGAEEASGGESIIRLFNFADVLTSGSSS
jgi:hypothetical protein